MKILSCQHPSEADEHGIHLRPWQGNELTDARDDEDAHVPSWP